MYYDRPRTRETSFEVDNGASTSHVTKANSQGQPSQSRSAPSWREKWKAKQPLSPTKLAQIASIFGNSGAARMMDNIGTSRRRAPALDLDPISNSRLASSRRALRSKVSTDALGKTQSLIVVVPPKHLMRVIPRPFEEAEPRTPTDDRREQEARAMERWRLQGMVVPLYKSLDGQRAAIAREFNLPSTGGLVIHLSDGADQRGPKIGAEAWTMHFGQQARKRECACHSVRASIDDNASILTPASTQRMSLKHDDSVASSPTSASLGHRPSPIRTDFTPTKLQLPALKRIVSGEVGEMRKSPQSATFPSSSEQTHASSPRSAPAYTSRHSPSSSSIPSAFAHSPDCPSFSNMDQTGNIVGKIEFDIIPEGVGSWYEPWRERKLQEREQAARSTAQRQMMLGTSPKPINLSMANVSRNSPRKPSLVLQQPLVKIESVDNDPEWQQPRSGLGSEAVSPIRTPHAYKLFEYDELGGSSRNSHISNTNSLQAAPMSLPDRSSRSSAMLMYENLRNLEEEVAQLSPNPNYSPKSSFRSLSQNSGSLRDDTLDSRRVPSGHASSPLREQAASSDQGADAHTRSLRSVATNLPIYQMEGMTLSMSPESLRTGRAVGITQSPRGNARAPLSAVPPQLQQEHALEFVSQFDSSSTLATDADSHDSKQNTRKNSKPWYSQSQHSPTMPSFGAVLSGQTQGGQNGVNASDRRPSLSNFRFGRKSQATQISNQNTFDQPNGHGPEKLLSPPSTMTSPVLLQTSLSMYNNLQVAPERPVRPTSPGQLLSPTILSSAYSSPTIEGPNLRTSYAQPEKVVKKKKSLFSFA